MSTGNAFAPQVLENVPDKASGRQEDEKMDTKTSAHALEGGDRYRQEGSFALRNCDEETALEVDVLILDFLICQAQMALLHQRRVGEIYASSQCQQWESEEGSSLKRNIDMADWFRRFFSIRHLTFRPDRELRIRSDLLHLTVLFTQRFSWTPVTPSVEDLQRLRQRNGDRAKAWIGTEERLPSLPWQSAVEMYEKQLPLPSEVSERNRAHVLHNLNIQAEHETNEPAFFGTSQCVSLLDILPSFMRVSAQRNALAGSNAEHKWFDLATEFMLQACLEQYLSFGASGTDAVDEAFAWGYKEDDYNDDDDDDGPKTEAALVNDLFTDSEFVREIATWQDCKTKALAQLFPASLSQTNGTVTPVSHQPPSSPLPSLLEEVAALHPLPVFEAAVGDFLAGLHESLEPPILVQLRHGCLTGMSRSETTAFLQACGLREMLPWDGKTRV